MTEMNSVTLVLVGVLFGILLGIIPGVGLGWYICRKKYRDKIMDVMRKKDVQIERFRNLYQVFYQWAQIRKNNGKVSSFFIRNEIDHIGVYGYGLIGRMLKQELEESGITVDYAIDRNAGKMTVDVPVYLPECELPPCSMMVITAQEVVDIRDKLVKKVSCPVVSVLDILETIDFL